MEPITRVRYFVLLGMLLVGAEACADNAVAPNGKTPQLRRDAVRAGGRRPTLFANTTKYRDKGLKHAHGRAAIATTAATAVALDARALIGRDGITTLDVSTGSIDDGTIGVGVLSKLQLKLYTLNGSLQTTNNYNGLNTPTYQVRLADRARGSNIQVQGSITTGGKHTDVITVTETVKARPDLRVDGITAPSQALPSSPVNISAMISEINGDVGARADCVLSVDGVEADRAHGIWVDAGRSVSCLFVHTFPATGTSRLTVSAVSTAPGDWDTANNTAVRSIDIVQPTSGWEGTYVASRDFTGTTFSEGWWTLRSQGIHAEWSNNQDWHRNNNWDAHVTGHFPAMAGAITYAFHDEMDGTLLNEIDFDPSTDGPVEDDQDYADPVFGTVHQHHSCSLSFRAEPETVEGYEVMYGYAYVSVCTLLRSNSFGALPGESRTDFDYVTTGGDVSYYGEHWEIYDDGLGGGSSFSFNGETSYQLGAQVYSGTAYTFSLSITGSERTNTAAGTMLLSAPLLTVVSIPYRCEDDDDGDFVQHACGSSNYSQTSIGGTASGG